MIYEAFLIFDDAKVNAIGALGVTCRPRTSQRGRQLARACSCIIIIDAMRQLLPGETSSHV